jgi:hypothetical protein
MKTRVLNINTRFGEEYEGRYVFSEISWAKRSRIIQKYTKYSKLTGQVENSDFIGIQAETIMASLKEQPAHKPMTFERLLDEGNGVPIALGELFSQIVNHLNSLTADETAFLSVQSVEASQPKFSQNSDYARNSVGHHTNSQSNPPKPSNSSQQS